MPKIQKILNTEETNAYFNQAYTKLANIIGKNIRQKPDDPTLNSIISSIINARGIFGLGGGISGDIIRILIMRLMHMGFEAYIVGETNTRAAGKKDLLIIASGSADYNFKKIKETGVKVLLFTSNTEVQNLDKNDLVIEIKGRRKQGKDISAKTFKSDGKIAPMGTLFETSLTLFIVALIALLMKKTDITEKEMEARHANIKH